MRQPQHPLAVLPLLVAIAFACACARARAEDNPIVTDRPDFVESAEVVGLGRFQIETGLLSERDRSNGVTTRTLTTPTLLRLGISETLELRAEGDGLTHERTTDAGGATQRVHGFSDVSFGAKWRVREGDASGMPGVAWLADLETPIGSKSVRGKGVRPAVRVTAEWELPHDFSIGVMPGVFLDRNDVGKRYAAGVLAVTLGKGLASNLDAFVEVAGERLAAERNGGSSVTFDTGLAWRVTPTLQLDLAFAHGLSSAAPDFQGGLGVSARF